MSGYPSPELLIRTPGVRQGHLGYSSFCMWARLTVFNVSALALGFLLLPSFSSCFKFISFGCGRDTTATLWTYVRVKIKVTVVFHPGVYCCEGCQSFRKDCNCLPIGVGEQSHPEESLDMLHVVSWEEEKEGPRYPMGLQCYERPGRAARGVGTQFPALLLISRRLFCSQQCLCPDLTFLLSQRKEVNVTRATDKGSKVTKCETTLGTVARREEAQL